MPFQGVNSQINLGLPQNAPEGFVDPQIRAAVELYLQVMNQLLTALETFSGITQKDVSLWNSLQPTDTLLRQNTGRFYLIAGENLSLGDLINLYDDVGVCKARKANAASGLVKPANGYWNVSGGTLLGAFGEAILSQGIIGVPGILSGQAIYLSTTPGTASITPPTGAGQLEQYIGVGIANDIAYIDIATGPYVQH